MMEFVRRKPAGNLNKFCLFQWGVSADLEKELGSDVKILADFKKMCHVGVISSGFNRVDVIFVQSNFEAHLSGAYSLAFT